MNRRGIFKALLGAVAAPLLPAPAATITKAAPQVWDPGHAHGVYDPGHCHTINDPGHQHSYWTPYDPQHYHGIPIYGFPRT
jgi:hypothetical protein